MVLGPAAVHADPLGIAVAFGAGMLSFLSPCVLPLVPGYLSMVSGLSAAELSATGHRAAASSLRNGSSDFVAAPAPQFVGASTGGSVATLPTRPEGPVGQPVGMPTGRTDVSRPRIRRLGGILAFIGGFTLVFVALGASASAVGRLLLTHQHVLEIASGLLIVSFGLLLVAMAAGVRLPAAFWSERRLPVSPSLLGAFAPPVLGMAFAFAWTPCIGPVLGSVLALAAGTGGSVLGGVVLLTAYSLGLGVPFLLVGLLFGRMTELMARVRPRLRVVELVGGAVLVAFGVLLVTGHVGVVSSTIGGWLRDLHLGRLSTS